MKEKSPGGSPDMPSLQLRQPALDPVSGENLADIESSSSVGEDAAEAPPQGSHEPLPEPAIRWCSTPTPLPALCFMHVTRMHKVRVAFQASVQGLGWLRPKILPKGA